MNLTSTGGFSVNSGGAAAPHHYQHLMKPAPIIANQTTTYQTGGEYSSNSSSLETSAAAAQQQQRQNEFTKSRPGIAIYNPDLRHNHISSGVGGRQSQTAHEEERQVSYPATTRRGIKNNCANNNSAMNHHNSSKSKGILMANSATPTKASKKLSSLRHPNHQKQVSSNLITIKNNNSKEISNNVKRTNRSNYKQHTAINNDEESSTIVNSAKKVKVKANASQLGRNGQVLCKSGAERPHQTKSSGNRVPNVGKSCGFKANRHINDDDDDDFEEKYIITGPAVPGKFKQDSQEVETKEILEQKAVEYTNFHCKQRTDEMVVSQQDQHYAEYSMSTESPTIERKKKQKGSNKLKINTYAGGINIHSTDINQPQTETQSGPSSRSKLIHNPSISASTAIINLKQDNQTVIENYDLYLKRKTQNILGGSSNGNNSKKHQTPSHGHYHSAQRKVVKASAAAESSRQNSSPPQSEHHYYFEQQQQYSRGKHSIVSHHHHQLSSHSSKHTQPKMTMIKSNNHRPPRHQFSEHLVHKQQQNHSTNHMGGVSSITTSSRNHNHNYHQGASSHIITKKQQQNGHSNNPLKSGKKSLIQSTAAGSTTSDNSIMFGGGVNAGRNHFQAGGGGHQQPLRGTSSFMGSSTTSVVVQPHNHNHNHNQHQHGSNAVSREQSKRNNSVVVQASGSRGGGAAGEGSSAGGLVNKQFPNISSGGNNGSGGRSAFIHQASIAGGQGNCRPNYRDKLSETAMDYSGEYKKPSVHERLLNNETKSLRPFNRRADNRFGSNKPIMTFDHIKQNAIKFVSSEYDYSAFLSSNGVFFGQNTNGASINEQYKKQILTTARTKISNDLRSSSGFSNYEKQQNSIASQQHGKQQNTSKNLASNTRTCNTSSILVNENQKNLGREESKKGTDNHTASTTGNNWFGRRSLPGAGLQLKFMNFENRLIRWILEKQGFKESCQDYGMPAQEFYNIANSANCNFLGSNTVVLIWSASVVKSNIYNNLGRFQKINHFPRSYEITRKDCLYDRYSRMQELYGNKNFNFMPQSFNCPQQNQALQAEMRKNRNQLWIMKPKASSQGKGIQVISSFDEVPRGAGQAPCLVQQYIQNPLLIDKYKWDLRIYVAVTSINPLRIYVYEEGLVRFASEKYDTSDLKNIFSHLTNYSINKKHKKTESFKDYYTSNATGKLQSNSYNQKFQQQSHKASDISSKSTAKSSAKFLNSTDNSDTGPQNPFVRPGSQLDSHSEFESKINITKSKWTLRAFKEYLKNLRHTSSNSKDVQSLDVDVLFSRIHDIVVKTIISAEPLLWNGIEMFVPNTYQFDTSSQIDTNKKNNNCFELLGFDILVDQYFKPWLLEVNLSPSLSTDTQLDFKVKGGLIADLFTLVGLQNEEMQNNIKNQTQADLNATVRDQNGNTVSSQGNSIGFGTSFQDAQSTNSGNQNLKNGAIVKRTFLPKVVKQKLNSYGGSSSQRKDQRCPFPIKPSSKAERSDYAMIEESVLENARRGSFIRVYPNEQHTYVYRNFFEEERRNDNILHNYIFHSKYRNMPIDSAEQDNGQMGGGFSASRHNINRLKMSDSGSVSIPCNSARKGGKDNHQPKPQFISNNPFSTKNSIKNDKMI